MSLISNTASLLSMFNFHLCKHLICAGILLLSMSAHATETLLLETFDNLTTDLTIGAQLGGAITFSEDISLNHNGSGGSLKANYPVSTGGVYAWSTYNIASHNTNNISLDFWAKMPNAKQGLKFIKIFGGNADGDHSNYANTTFSLDYTGIDPGGMYSVAFGDGTTISNDTQQIINLNGENPQLIGRSYGQAVISTPTGPWRSSDWGTTWHHFRIRVKFNSGTSASNEVADGSCYLEIDGKVYVNATGLFNRHYSNTFIDRVEFFGWSQNGDTPFELWYDDIKITIGTSPPMPPENLQVH